MVRLPIVIINYG